MLIKNESGMTLVEIMISAGIIAFLSVSSFKLMEMMNKSNKKSQNKVVQNNLKLRVKRVLDNSVQGLDSTVFESEIFYQMEVDGNFTRKGLTKTGVDLKQFNAPVGNFSSFNIVKKLIDTTNGNDFTKNYDTVCIPVEFAYQKIIFSEYRDIYTRRPFVRSNDGNKKVYCCEKETPNCTEEKNRLAHDGSEFVSRIVGVPRGVINDSDELETIPAFGELLDVTGVGYFLYTHIDDPNLLTTGYFSYNSECFNKKIAFKSIDKANCDQKFTIKYNFKGQLFDQTIGIGVNELGSELDF
jgi:type II secretory pathway pseudopilin PulG